MDTGYILEQCRSLNRRLIEWRRLLHRIPEVGVDLPETEAAVRSVLEELDVRLQEDYRGAGLVAVLEGGKAGGRTVAVRADIDALEIEEEPYLAGGVHLERLHHQPVEAGGGAPVDTVVAVTRLIFAHFFEFHTLPFEHTLVLTDQLVVDDVPGTDMDPTNLFENFLRDHGTGTSSKTF